jgi:hypothetical protein
MVTVNFEPGKNFRGTRVYHQKDDLAYAYTTSYTSVDADGAPNAYHPDDVGRACAKEPHVGLECPQHAGYPHTSWWDKVLVPDTLDPSVAYRQPSGPYKDFFVCMTSLRKYGGDKFDPGTYVDATKVPYVVIPTGFNQLSFSAKQGDVGLATHLESGVSVAFIVADYGGGSKAKLGESSIALFEALGGENVNPQNGAGVLSGTYQYVIFKNSRLPRAERWPRSTESIQQQVVELIENTPDIGKLSGLV